VVDQLSDPDAWFDQLYREAAGDPARVPWARGAPHRYVTSWLDQPGLDLTGVDAVVIERGLDIALLGMSFLNRVEMKREGQTMTLIRRF